MVEQVEWRSSEENSLRCFAQFPFFFLHLKTKLHVIPIENHHFVTLEVRFFHIWSLACQELNALGMRHINYNMQEEFFSSQAAQKLRSRFGLWKVKHMPEHMAALIFLINVSSWASGSGSATKRQDPEFFRSTLSSEGKRLSSPCRTDVNEHETTASCSSKYPLNRWNFGDDIRKTKNHDMLHIRPEGSTLVTLRFSP